MCNTSHLSKTRQRNQKQSRMLLHWTSQLRALTLTARQWEGRFAIPVQSFSQSSGNNPHDFPTQAKSRLGTACSFFCFLLLLNKFSFLFNFPSCLWNKEHDRWKKYIIQSCSIFKKLTKKIWVIASIEQHLCSTFMTDQNIPEYQERTSSDQLGRETNTKQLQNLWHSFLSRFSWFCLLIFLRK